MLRQFGLAGLLTCAISAAYATDMEREFAWKIADAIQYTNKHAADIWPDYRFTRTPLIGHFNDDQGTFHFYAFSFKPTNKAWQLLPIDGQSVYFLDKDIYNIGNIAWGFEKIDKQETFVILQYEPTTLGNAAYTLASRFRQYQFYESGSKFPESKYDPYYEPSYAWINDQVQLARLNYLEAEALKQYLSADNASEKDTFLKDAVALHQYRATLLDNEGKQFEPTSAINWGLSNYVSWKTLNLNSEPDYLQAIDRSCELLDGADSTEAVRGCTYMFNHNFATVVYGVALDKLVGNSWKVSAQSKRVSPQETLQKYIGMSDEEATNRVTRILAEHRYYLDRINQGLNKYFIPFTEAIAKLDEAYQQTSGIELQIFNDDMKMFAPAAVKKQAGYTTRAREDDLWINNKVVMHQDFSLIADRVKGLSQKYYLKVDHLPYGYDSSPWSNWGSDWTKFKVTPETKLVINGKADTVGHFVQSKEHVKIKSLRIENESVLLVLNGTKGDLDASTGILKLQFSFD